MMGQFLIRNVILSNAVLLSNYIFIFRNVQSVREAQGILNMISCLPNLVHIELGYSANDAILLKIATTCHNLK